MTKVSIVHTIPIVTRYHGPTSHRPSRIIANAVWHHRKLHLCVRTSLRSRVKHEATASVPHQIPRTASTPAMIRWG